MSNNDWKELAELWQADAEISLQDLSKKTRRKTLLLYLIAGFEMIAGLGAAMVGAWVIWRDLGQFEFWLGILVILFAAGGTYVTWWSRRGTWNATSDSLIDQLRLAKQRAVAGRRLADANLWSTIPTAGIFSLVLIDQWDGIVDAYPEWQIRVLIYAIAPLLVMAGLSVWYKRKKRKEFERIETILAEMEKD